MTPSHDFRIGATYENIFGLRLKAVDGSPWRWQSELVGGDIRHFHARLGDREWHYAWPGAIVREVTA